MAVSLTVSGAGEDFADASLAFCLPPPFFGFGHLLSLSTMVMLDAADVVVWRGKKKGRARRVGGE